MFERDASGQPIRMIGTCQDVTERKRAERELREADRRKDEFLAMLSHELRNPLAPILNAVEILERAGPGEEELRSTFQAVIARQVQHMKRLLDDLLDVSRVSQGKIELRKQPVELATLLLQAVEVSRPLIDREAAAARADAGATSRCRSTPIRPAWSRCSRTSSTTPRSHADAAGTSRCRPPSRAARRSSACATTASACRAELLARAFDLFVQETRAFDRAQGGLGIGLTMVRTLVKMHGGSVQAFSEGPGRGSELVVRLPLGGGA